MLFAGGDDFRDRERDLAIITFYCATGTTSLAKGRERHGQSLAPRQFTTAH